MPKNGWRPLLNTTFFGTDSDEGAGLYLRCDRFLLRFIRFSEPKDYLNANRSKIN
jgi:hypothetical protein